MLQAAEGLNAELQRSPLVQDGSLASLAVVPPLDYVSYPPLLWGPHSGLLRSVLETNRLHLFQPMAEASNARYFFDLYYSSLYGSLTNPCSTPFRRERLPLEAFSGFPPPDTPGALDILFVDTSVRTYSVTPCSLRAASCGTLTSLRQYTVLAAAESEIHERRVVQWSVLGGDNLLCGGDTIATSTDHCAREYPYTTETELDNALDDLQALTEVRLAPAMLPPPPARIAARQVRSYLLTLSLQFDDFPSSGVLGRKHTFYAEVEDLILSPRSPAASSELPVLGGFVYNLYQRPRTVLVATAVCTPPGEPQRYYAVLYGKDNMAYLRQLAGGGEAVPDPELLNQKVRLNYILAKVPVAQLGLAQTLNSTLSPYGTGSGSGASILALLPMTVSTEAAAERQDLTYLGYRTMPVPPPPLEDLDWSAMAYNESAPGQPVVWQDHATFTLAELQRLRLVSGSASPSSVDPTGTPLRSTLQGVLVIGEDPS